MTAIFVGVFFGFSVALLIIHFKQAGWIKQSRECLAEMDTKLQKLADGDMFLDENWEPGTETEVLDETESWSIGSRTQCVCNNCGGKIYLKSGQCARCDLHLI